MISKEELRLELREIIGDFMRKHNLEELIFDYNQTHECLPDCYLTSELEIYLFSEPIK